MRRRSRLRHYGLPVEGQPATCQVPRKWVQLGMRCEVVISKLAGKQLLGVPKHIARKLDAWVELVSEDGLSEARRIPGLHDEPLKGKRTGQRSSASAGPTGPSTRCERAARSSS